MFWPEPIALRGAQTVTVTAQDADANRAAGDRDTLAFQVTVLVNPTVAANPATLTEANLNGAALTVTLPSVVPGLVVGWRHHESSGQGQQLKWLMHS